MRPEHSGLPKESIMRNKRFTWKAAALLALVTVWLCGITVFAEGASGDNSLSSLGITTEGAVVSPEFYYSTIEYNVTVPAGTTELSLDPVPSNGNAWIVDITGTQLVDGQTTVQITVSAENGSQYSYYLYVKEDASAGTTPAAETTAETQPQTETETEEETEPETEDPRYIKVDRNSLEEAEKTINTLKNEASSYRDRLGIMMKILYGLIGFCVILLFVVINLILKKKDLKAELQNYRGFGYPQASDYDGDGYGQEYPEQDAYAQGGYVQESNSQTSASDFEDGQGYMEDYGAGEPVKPEKGRRSKSRRSNDDPETVPKPSKARKKAKKMPEYEETGKQKYSYQEPKKDQASDDVEVTMIDL